MPLDKLQVTSWELVGCRIQSELRNLQWDKTVADQNKVREKQKLLGDTEGLLRQYENQGK